MTELTQSFKDFEIVQSVVSGDVEAYASLVRDYHTKVLRLCLSLLSDRSETEDAAQDVFIKAYQSLSKFRGNSSFSTWLYRIASNHCHDVLRKKSRQKTESWDALLEQEGEKIHHLFSTSDRLPLSSNDSDLIHSVLSCLPLQYRTILVLREVERLNYREIASVLDCSLDAVKARLRRARQELQEKYDTFQKSKSSK